jgi:crotonobetainyl-CoA hydratase
MATAVRTERHDAVVEVVLDRPKANAIDTATSRELAAAFASFRDDPDVRVAILTGGGERFFSAGWDLKAAAAGEEGADTDHGPGGFGGLTEMFDLDKPVIAALNGMAVGGGLELALACDLIVAAEGVELFLSEVTVGMIPDAGGLFRLPRWLPRAVALEMLLTGRRMSADEAARWGLVNRVVPRAELMPAAHELAGRIIAAAPLAVAAVKEVLRATEHMGVEDAYATLHSGKLAAYERMLRSEDIEEGPRAFAEGRPPSWQGR